MATTFKISYAANATPIEAIQATDTNNVASLIHSSIDKSIGGRKEISCGTTATNVAYSDYTTNSTATTLLTAGIGGGNITGIDFLMIAIRAAGSTGTPDVTLRLASGDTSTQVLSGVGDVILLRPSGWASNDYELYSSGATETAKLDIIWGII